MSKEKFLCLSMECTNKVERHPFNFDTGFCKKCQNELNKVILENILP